MHSGIRCSKIRAIAEAVIEVMSDISMFSRRGGEKKKGSETR
jgi:hypothetical protein